MRRLIFTALISATVAGLITYYFTTTSTSSSICMDYSGSTPSTLTSELVRKMINKYENVQLDNHKTSSSKPIPKDAEAIWFDLETLKKFVYQIEHNVAKNDPSKSNTNLGVRIYYASYPETSVLEDLKKHQKDPDFTINSEYQGLHTLVMIPTISNGNGTNLDFNPLDIKTYNGFVKMDQESKYSFLSNDYTTLTVGPSFDPANTSSTTSVSARNHGVLFPPESINGLGFK